MATLKDFSTHFSVGVSNSKSTKHRQIADDHDARGVLEARDQTGRILRVTFDWQSDRLAHSISVSDGDRFQAIVSSVEGDGHEAWPPSPPIQQLDREPGQGESSVLLGLGMAGHSHWAISVEARRAPLSLLFDVACRTRGSVGRLGSSYAPIVRPARREPDAALFERSCGPVRIEVDSRDEAPAELRWDGTHLAIVSVAEPASDPYTYRWRYRVLAP
jgi:hypothetical protein